MMQGLFEVGLWVITYCGPNLPLLM